ncbi:hypothetical protein BANRA_05672 [Klebsiella pneumoniae]|nr:hypothetical protein BANRA_05672 [Klebsiella pneumoniae]
MRYWLLVILMNVLFYFIVKHVAPEWYGSLVIMQAKSSAH